MPKRISNLRGEDGQALVELALVVPLLLFILFAIIDFGLALNQYNDATNLANIGARSTAVLTTGSHPSTCVYNGQTYSTLVGYVDCEGAVQGVLSNVSVTVCDPSAPSTSGGTLTITAGDSVSVKVNSTFSWLKVLTGGIGRIGPVAPITSTIGSAATMRAEATSTNATSVGNWLGTESNSGSTVPGQGGATSTSTITNGTNGTCP